MLERPAGASQFDRLVGFHGEVRLKTPVAPMLNAGSVVGPDSRLLTTLVHSVNKELSSMAVTKIAQFSIQLPGPGPSPFTPKMPAFVRTCESTNFPGMASIHWPDFWR